MPPPAATISVRNTLDFLDGPFASFARGIIEDRYALWLGSGISRGRVDGLHNVIRRVLTYLQQRVTTGDASCRFRVALEEILELVHKTANLDCQVSDWEDLDETLQSLVPNYEKLLNVTVKGEEPDFLLWEAVNVREVFADPGATPDAEHLCTAILALEGVASDIATANWDGLIELSVAQLGGNDSILTVCVTGEDLRLPASRSRLYKFHGCAIRARDDEEHYRPLLISRLPQIHGWVTDPSNAAMAGKLISIIVGKPTLMVGLSAQDANILHIFNQAKAQLPWTWPADMPAYVFAENNLGPDQLGLLECVYKDYYTVDTRTDIRQSALIQAFAKPLLLALVLYICCAKLRRLVEKTESPTLSAAELNEISSGLYALRNIVANSVEPDHFGFMRNFIAHTGKLFTLFKEGIQPQDTQHYQPISATPVQQMDTDPALPQSGLRELAVAVSLFGNGVENNIWNLKLSEPTDPKTGALIAEGGSGPARVFFAANSHAALRLHTEGYLSDDEEDVIVVHSLDMPPKMARGPSASRGRSGRTQERAVSIAQLLNGPTSAADLLQRFREEVAL